MVVMENRANILNCALLLFASKGYEAVGVQEVCEAAGITKPTLYYYFGSKRGLLDALFGEYFTLLLQVVKEAADYQHDLPLTLHRVAAVYFRFASEHEDFYRMQLAMSFAPPESDPTQAMFVYGRDQYFLLEELFVGAAADHGNMKGRQRAYAVTFLGMINSYISLWLLGHIVLDDALTFQAVHQFMHGIYS